jgi:hypothetical protein
LALIATYETVNPYSIKMKPVAIISVNNSPDYLSLVPIVCKSWHLQGFETLVIGVGLNHEQKQLLIAFSNSMYAFPENEQLSELNPALFTQLIRIYWAAKFGPNHYAILTDSDMFIGSSFLYRDFDKVNVFGHDLTGYEHTPICYVGMTGDKWKEVLGTEGMVKDLEKYADINASQHRAWTADQDILTGRLKEYGFDRINRIDRGVDKRGLPVGRWDRYGGFKMPDGEVHDVHLLRDPLSDENFPKIVSMCNKLYPKEDWRWLFDYRKAFLK